jgi:hypothetical protein
MQTQRAPTSYRADILRSADILSAVGRGTFCHPSSAKRLAGQHVRHPAARRMHALRHGAPACRSADILSAVGRGTFCHPSSAKRLAGQHVRHPAARRMHALRHRSADILSAVGEGTFCHPSSAKRLAGQYVRHPAARRMHALRHAESLKALASAGESEDPAPRHLIRLTTPLKRRSSPN